MNRRSYSHPVGAALRRDGIRAKSRRKTAPAWAKGSGARFKRVVGIALLAVALAGCGPKRTAEKSAEEAAQKPTAAAPVSFKEGRGLQIAPETARAIGLATADVQEREISPRFALNVTVLKAGTPATAYAIVSPEVADELNHHAPREAKIVGESRALTTATSQVELTFELATDARPGAIVPLVLSSAAIKNAVVPESAILRSATGTFLYVENGGALLRTAVKIGASDGRYSEVVDGIYSGDVVAVSAVEQLWLTELRLTKGGGHSH